MALKRKPVRYIETVGLYYCLVSRGANLKIYRNWHDSDTINLYNSFSGLLCCCHRIFF